MAIAPDEEEQVRRAVQAFFDAFNSHDWRRSRVGIPQLLGDAPWREPEVGGSEGCYYA